MPIRFHRVLLLLCLVTIAGGQDALAQATFESTGERALGMGGAFVAVANDATAVHWNPAGLASGGPAGMTIGWYRSQSGNHDAVPYAGPDRRSGTLTSLGTWPVGVSYGNFTITGLRAGSTDGELVVDSLHTSQFGVTVLQSVVQGLIVGSTVKYVRGGIVSAPADAGTVGAALDATDDLEGPRSGAIDLDIGVMADMRRVRVGVTMKNLRSPTFDDGAGTAITLQRQARLGVAVLPVNGVTLAMDIDLDTVDLRGDLRRNLALGGEGRLGRRLAVRSGVRWSLKGARRLIGAAGVSIGLRETLWLDGHYAHSRLDEDREFGVALRAGL